MKICDNKVRKLRVCSRISSSRKRKMSRNNFCPFIWGLGRAFDKKGLSIFWPWKRTGGWDWWLSPVTLLLEGKHCGMAGGCYGLNRADGSIAVAALRPPCQGKAHRGREDWPSWTQHSEFESQATLPDPVLNIVIIYLKMWKSQWNINIKKIRKI